MEQHSASPPATILLMEHEPVARTSMAKLLCEAGFHVIEAGQTDEAWRTLERLPDVGVLVADLDAPGGADRLELVRKVHERWPAMGMVMTSTHIRHLRPSEVPGEGCFLPRPLPADTLVREVRVAAHQTTG